MLDQSETALLPPLKLPTSVLHRPCSCTPGGACELFLGVLVVGAAKHSFFGVL